MTSVVAHRALVLHRQTPGIREERLTHILTFFGVPWQTVGVAEITAPPASVRNYESYAVLGSVDLLADALAAPRSAAVLAGASAWYGYAGDDQASTARALSALAGGDWKWVRSSPSPAVMRIAADLPDVAGAMSGVHVAAIPGPEDGVVAPSGANGQLVPIVSVDGAPSFVRTTVGGVPAYLCASAGMVDIDEPVRRNYYDIKDHFLSAVPLVMFITSTFPDVVWRPPERGACLIIDDPLLKDRYGFCDFPRLRDLMREHWFTTNIAFIPWNWRRTTRRASEFFRREADLFSVSVHGCDHVAAEFGAMAPDVIDSRARLAQARMRRHRARTRIKHDPIMVFPQGVFSSSCPAILKRNGFVAAVNTEISPVEESGPKTLIRDAWDSAILRYGSFPIFTRRYQHHGLENFAFDLLLGKPCFIVTHHEEFRDGGAAVARLVDALRALNGTLKWRSPREVVRRAWRARSDDGRVSVRMYAAEALFANASDDVCEFAVYKPESEPSLVSKISLGGRALSWGDTADGVQFRCTLPPRSEALVRVRYKTNLADPSVSMSMRYELGVAARRILSELRDEYVLRFARPA